MTAWTWVGTGLLALWAVLQLAVIACEIFETRCEKNDVLRWLLEKI